MGSKSKSKSKRRKQLEDTTDDDLSSSPSLSSEESERSSKRHRRRKDDGGSRREKERREKRRSKRETKRRKSKKKKRVYGVDDDDESGSGRSGDDSEPDRSRFEPQPVLRQLFIEFPNVGNDLKQLLEMIDCGQAVDIKGISERSLIKHLKKLFRSLELKENNGVFLLPSNARPTLEVVGLMIQKSLEPKIGQNEVHLEQPDEEHRQVVDDNKTTVPCMEDVDTGPKRRMPQLSGGYLSNVEERTALESRFAREVNMMSRVKHENLVKFIGACKEPLMVIVTELLPGMSLRKYLMSIRPNPLELHVAIKFSLDIAHAMECLHANGIIHRDLKPDNLLLTTLKTTNKVIYCTSLN